MTEQRPFRHRASARGAVLILTLIVLVVMIMASVAMVRSVDITTQIAGNLAFRQSGVQAADSGVELARKWLMTGGADLTVDHLPSYFSTWSGGLSVPGAIFDPLNPVTFKWDERTTLPVDAAGNTVAYVVHRMCEFSGDPGESKNNCLTAPTSASGNSNRIKEGGEFACTGSNCTASSNPYYRITVKVTGPRNTVSYIQSVIY